MVDEPNNLRQAMAEASRPTTQITDPQRLVETCKRLLRQQQEFLVSERSRYETERTERANWYRSEMTKLADEAESERLALDQRWYKTESEIALNVQRIKALLSVAG